LEGELALGVGHKKNDVHCEKYENPQSVPGKKGVLEKKVLRNP